MYPYALQKNFGKFKSNRLAFLTVGLGVLACLFAVPLIFTELMTIPYFEATYYGVLFFYHGMSNRHNKYTIYDVYTRDI